MKTNSLDLIVALIDEITPHLPNPETRPGDWEWLDGLVTRLDIITDREMFQSDPSYRAMLNFIDAVIDALYHGFHQVDGVNWDEVERGLIYGRESLIYERPLDSTLLAKYA